MLTHVSTQKMYPPSSPAFEIIDLNNRSIPDMNEFTLVQCPLANGSRPPWFQGPLDDYDMFRLIVNVGLVSGVCLLGFIGNALTIATLKQDSRNRKKTTNWLLQVLAMLDIIYLSSALITHSYQTLLELTTLESVASTSQFGSFTVQLVLPYVETAAKFVRSLSRTAIVWVVVLVTVDRYMAVCRPLLAIEVRTLRRTQIAVAVVLIAALLYNVPRMFEISISTIQDRCTSRLTSKIWQTSLRINKIYMLVYHTIFYFVFRSVGPLIVLVMLNTRLAVALRLVHRRRRLITSGNGRGRGRAAQRENLTLMLVVVVTVFVVCELPDVCLRLTVTLFEFEHRMYVNTPAIRHALVICNGLHVLNSSVNFIIYCLLGCRFRRILRGRIAEVCSSLGTVDTSVNAIECRRLAADNNNSAGGIEMQVLNGMTSRSRPLDYGTATVHAAGSQLPDDIVNMQITRPVDDLVECLVERPLVVVLCRPLGDGVSV